MDDTAREALEELASALRSPSDRALEDAKALFPFVLHEASLNEQVDEPQDSRGDEAAPAPEATPDSVGRHPVTPHCY